MSRYWLIGLLLALSGCQSLPSAEDGRSRDVVFVTSENCLSQFIEDQKRVQLGPCLILSGVNGQSPEVCPDGFVELPAGRSASLEVTCVPRHQDGKPQQGRRARTTLAVPAHQIDTAGRRWYLNTDESLVRNPGCKPMLSPAAQPASYRSGVSFGE
jgi:hypothetical protein